MKRILRFLLKFILWFFIVTVCWVIFYRFVNPPVTYLMITRYFESEQKEKKIDKEWKYLESISSHLPLAVVAAEDQNFNSHFGFDLNAIEKAMEQNKKKKKRPVKGASTISQQVAKNVFLFPSRSWIRKGFEVYFTFLIECFWNKKRIMEVYLNVAELGNGIYGAESASKKFFRKSSINLSKAEAALLAAVLPNPRKMSAARPSSYALRRQAWIINQMNNLEGEKIFTNN